MRFGDIIGPEGVAKMVIAKRRAPDAPPVRHAKRPTSVPLAVQICADMLEPDDIDRLRMDVLAHLRDLRRSVNACEVRFSEALERARGRLATWSLDDEVADPGALLVDGCGNRLRPVHAPH